jgi:proteasome accessory factor C
MEAACLLLGLESLELLPQAVSEFGLEDIQSVRDKITSVLTNIPRIGFVEGSKSPDPETLDKVEEALRSDKQLKILYWNNSRDDVTERKISPYSTRLDDGEVVLDAWCHQSDAWRSFRVERIREIEILDSPIPDVAQSFTPMPVAHVVVEVDEPNQHLLEVLTWSGEIERENGKLRVTAAVAQPQWLARKIITSGGRMKAVSPAEFVAQVHTHIKQALAVYE